MAWMVVWSTCPRLWKWSSARRDARINRAVSGPTVVECEEGENEDEDEDAGAGACEGES